LKPSDGLDQAATVAGVAQARAVGITRYDGPDARRPRL